MNTLPYSYPIPHSAIIGKVGRVYFVSAGVHRCKVDYAVDNLRWAVLDTHGERLFLVQGVDGVVGEWYCGSVMIAPESFGPCGSPPPHIDAIRAAIWKSCERADEIEDDGYFTIDFADWSDHDLSIAVATFDL